MDTKQFVKHYDGIQPPPPNAPTYQAPAGGWPGVPGFVAWTDHRGGGRSGGGGGAADPQPSCPTDDDGGGGAGEEGGRRCAPARKAAPPPATVRVLCGLALDVRPEQSLPPGPPVRVSRPEVSVRAHLRARACVWKHQRGNSPLFQCGWARSRALKQGTWVPCLTRTVMSSQHVLPETLRCLLNAG